MGGGGGRVASDFQHLLSDVGGGGGQRGGGYGSGFGSSGYQGSRGQFGSSYGQQESFSPYGEGSGYGGGLGGPQMMGSQQPQWGPQGGGGWASMGSMNGYNTNVNQSTNGNGQNDNWTYQAPQQAQTAPQPYTSSGFSGSKMPAQAQQSGGPAFAQGGSVEHFDDGGLAGLAQNIQGNIASNWGANTAQTQDWTYQAPQQAQTAPQQSSGTPGFSITPDKSAAPTTYANPFEGLYQAADNAQNDFTTLEDAINSGNTTLANDITQGNTTLANDITSGTNTLATDIANNPATANNTATATASNGNTNNNPYGTTSDGSTLTGSSGNPVLTGTMGNSAVSSDTTSATSLGVPSVTITPLTGDATDTAPVTYTYPDFGTNLNTETGPYYNGSFAPGDSPGSGSGMSSDRYSTFNIYANGGIIDLLRNYYHG